MTATFDFRESGVVDTIKQHVREDANQLDFSKLAEHVCGDTIATNIMMVGYASQKGLLPVSPQAIEKAIELNGVAIKANLTAFAWGQKICSRSRGSTANPRQTEALNRQAGNPGRH